MKLTRGKNVTPKHDIAKEEERVRAIEEAARKPRKSYSLSDASLSVGDILHYVKDEGITARVVAEKKIIFEENETSLSASALVLLQRDGYNWRKVNGWHFWMFENETLVEQLNRILAEQSTDNEQGCNLTFYENQSEYFGSPLLSSQCGQLSACPLAKRTPKKRVV